MSEIKEIEAFVRSVIRTESEAVAGLEALVDDSFALAVKAVFESRGRVIVTGIGKSAIIAEKIVATMNSTGTPAVFMHAADAIHGDLGIICPDDIVICLSKSGTTPEIKLLIPFIKSRGNKIIALVCNTESYLAQMADYRLNAYVPNEACPNNLAPTSSTTAQLVVGDAFAMTLLKMRGFTSEDFARSHPGGALGKKLYTTVGDILSKSLVPTVSLDAPLNKVIIEISSKMLGATAVVDGDNSLLGIITDGDLRRMLQRGGDLMALKASDIMTLNPRTVSIDELALKAFSMMEERKITQLVVLDGQKYCGMIHIHDILREGII